MLDRTTKKFFKYIYKNPKNQSVSNLKKHFPVESTTAFYESYKLLLQEQLIANYEGSIQLTIKGKDYYHDLWINRFKWLLSLIVIPILVSYITTKLTVNDDQCSNDTYNYYNSDIKER